MQTPYERVKTRPKKAIRKVNLSRLHHPINQPPPRFPSSLTRGKERLQRVFATVLTGQEALSRNHVRRY